MVAALGPQCGVDFGAPSWLRKTEGNHLFVLVGIKRKSLPSSELFLSEKAQPQKLTRRALEVLA